MKKIFVVATCFSLFLISCGGNPEKRKDVNTGDSTAIKKDLALSFAKPVDSSKAKKMINDFKLNKNKYKFDGIVWAYFDTASMRKIYSDPNVIDVRFFIGMFPSDDPTPSKKDAPVIILQVKRKSAGESLLPTYDYYTGDSICPPPNDSSCGTVENPSGN